MASGEHLEIYQAPGTKVRCLLSLALRRASSDVTFSLCHL